MAKVKIDGHELDEPVCYAFDSMSSIELANRNWHKYFYNTKAKDGRQWWGGSTDDIEQFWVSRLGSVRKNMVVLAHVDEQKDEVHGTFVRNPALPGRLRKQFSQAWAEFYHSKVETKGNEKRYVLQTQEGGGYYAATQIDAPDGCENNWAALWSKWKGPHIPIHVAIFGEMGTGKTHFLKSCPKPLHVFMFDGWNKDMPLRKGGEVTLDTEDLVIVQHKDGPIYIQYFADRGQAQTMLQHLGDVRAPITHAKPTAWPRFTAALHSIGL